MVGLRRSRSTRFIDSSNDVKHHRNGKRNFDDSMKESVRRDLRVIEDSMKELEHSDLTAVDSDYFQYLSTDLMSARTSQNKNGININGTDNDAQFDLFLSCLKPYGVSCILEVSTSNGLLEPIIYGLDESGKLLNKRVLRSHNKHLVSSKDCSVNSDGSDSLCRVSLQKDAVKVHDRYPSRNNNKVNNTKKVKAKRECMINDGDYALFLSSNFNDQEGPDEALVREAYKHKRFRAKSSKEGKQYALRSDVKVEASVKKNDEYAGRVEGSRVITRERAVEFENSGDVMVDGDADSVDTHVETERANVIGQDDPYREFFHEANKRGRFNANSSNEEKTYPLRSKDNVTKNMKVDTSEPWRKNDKYADLSTGLGVEDSRLTSRDQPDDGTYYVDENGVCFSEPAHLDNVIKVEDDDETVYIVNTDGEKSCDFRKDLIENLRKPYNHKEFKELYNEISTRKLVDRHIDLRHGRAASYSGQKKGKSYLDQHPVLRRRLEEAKDDYKKLNLLRGFFFWLQYLTREKAFEPWNDMKCLAVLPQDVRKRKQQI